MQSFQFCKGLNIFEGNLRSADVQVDQRTVPWNDKIPVQFVLISFKKMTRSKNLSAQVNLNLRKNTSNSQKH